MLGTVDQHRRKGYARVCAAAATAMLSAATGDNGTAFAYIVDGNVASETLFGSLGYQHADGFADWMGWECCAPNGSKHRMA